MDSITTCHSQFIYLKKSSIAYQEHRMLKEFMNCLYD